MRMIAVLLVIAPAMAYADDATMRLSSGEGLGAMRAVTDRTSATATVGWDDARHAMQTGVTAEGAVGHGVSILGGAIGDDAVWRPYAGAKLRVTREAAVSLVYKAEGFSEPEGELEASLTVGHGLGAAYGMLAGTYGQDPEGNERDAEVSAALLGPLGPFVGSSLTRVRRALGPKLERGVRWDAVADVGVALPFGRYAVRGALGYSVVGAERVLSGPLAGMTVSVLF